MKSPSAMTPAFMAAARIMNPSPNHGIDSRAISEQEFQGFQWMSEYASAGYCNVKTAVGAIVTCDDNVCTDVAANRATVVAKFDSKHSSTEGIILLDTVNSAIVVTFAGTDSNSLIDFTVDIDIALDDTSLCSGCQVHSGFQSAWDSVKDDIFTKLAALNAQYPVYSTSFTGHSLGAGLATLGCTAWRAAGHFCDLYTFGSPRVGNLAFATFVSAQTSGTTWRMTHLDDPVPRLPPKSLGYYHTNVEYWLSTGSAETTAYTDADVVVCNGYYNQDCNGAKALNLDFTAHSYYLRHISVCS